MTYEQFIAGREQDIIPEREVWDAAQAAAQAEVAERLRLTMAGQTGGGMTWMDADDARAILAHIDALTAERGAAVAEVAQIVAWLRLQAVKTDNAAKMSILAAIADAIEAGAHK